MDIILIPLLGVISTVLKIYTWIVVASVIVSWLVHFNVINTNNHFMLMLMEFLYRVTEPVFRKIRRFVPVLNGFDLAPIALLLLIWFLQAIIERLIIRLALW